MRKLSLSTTNVLSRRALLKGSLAGLSLAVLACDTKSDPIIPGGGTPGDDDDIDLPQPSQPESEPDAEPSQPEDPPDNNAYVIDLNEYPQLKDVGGVQFFVTDLGNQIAVTRTGGTEVTAVSIICTHDECVLELDSNAQDPLDGMPWFSCTCCDSQMDAKGSVIMEPATEPLTQYTADINGNEIFVYNV